MLSYHFHEHWLVGQLSTSIWHVTMKAELAETWQGHFGLVNTPQFQCLFPKNLPGWPQKPPETSHLAKIHMFFLPRSHDIWIKESTPHWLGITFLGDMDQVWDTTWYKGPPKHDRFWQEIRRCLRMSTFCIHQQVWLWNWSSKRIFFHENFPIGSINNKKINLQPTPKKCQYPLLEISLGCSENFFPPLIFKSQRGGVRFLQGCRFVVRGPQNTEMQRIFSPTNFRREVIGTHCANALDDSIPEAGNQRRPAGCCRTIQFKINDKCIWLYHSWAPKNIWWILKRQICVPNFAVSKFW